ncbi:MAG: hypothetical protein GF330_11835 [Candidatus Eisenbacteria bacterium]|nr:hypothetical protein [Candidatus Eisenbacteria bacterium]
MTRKRSDQTEHPDWAAILDAVESAVAASDRSDSPDQTPDELHPPRMTEERPPTRTPEELRAIREHLETCPQCARLAQDARDLRERLAAHRAETPHAALREQVLRHILRQFARPRRAAAALRRAAERWSEVWAHLVDDSLAPSAAFRASVVDAGPRILLYESDHHSITLSLQSQGEGDRFDLAGQVIPDHDTPLPSSAQAILHRGEALQEAPLSAHGEFAFRDLPATASQPETELDIVLEDLLIRLSLPPARRDA